MSQPPQILAQQAEALIRMLHVDAAAACARESEQAAVRARELLRAAYRDARQLVRDAVQEERERRDSALSQARAALATRRRQQSQHAANDVVQAAWNSLPQVLLAIWDDPPQRLEWCRNAISGAARVLRPAHWTMRCPATLTASEPAALVALAREAGVREITVQRDTSLQAGIAILSAGGVFDATVAGLLADQAGIEAELHAAWLAESSA